MIDAHIHFWRIARGDNALDAGSPLRRDFEPVDLQPLLGAAEVDSIVVVQAAETHAENLYTIGLAARHPVIAGVIAWIDPGSPAIDEEIAALKLTGVVKGFRPVRDGNLSIHWMLDPRLSPGYEAIRRSGMSLDILIEDPSDVPRVLQLARQHPDLSIMLNHCGQPDIAGGLNEPWASDIADVASCANVSCKFSALLNRAALGAGVAELAPYASHVVQIFGACRLLWASNWPPLTRVSDYATWRQLSRELLAPLSFEDRALIEHGNARRVYRL